MKTYVDELIMQGVPLKEPTQNGPAIFQLVIVLQVPNNFSLGM